MSLKSLAVTLSEDYDVEKWQKGSWWSSSIDYRIAVCRRAMDKLSAMKVSASDRGIRLINQRMREISKLECALCD